MKSEQKTCQNCQGKFVIDAEDFDFYKQIKVSPPAWCPDCRQQRRYAWRNERVLYRRDCDLCGKSMVTIYSPNKPYKVYCPPCWWGDGWDALEYGRDFDFDRPFFEQFHELQLEAPRIALLTKNSINSEYTNHSGENKNCYLCFGTFNAENDLYCTNMYRGETRDCIDCHHITDGGELLYECVDTKKSYGCQYSMLLRDCRDCYYSFDLRGCSDCFLSWNLRGQKYHILNKPYSKEEYFERLEEMNIESFESRRKLYSEWLALMKKALHRFAMIEKSTNISGSGILNCKNVHHSFDADDAEDLKYSTLCADVKNSMDSYHFGLAAELIYESHGLVRGYNVLFTHLCYDDSHIQYCDTCHNSQNIFGCVSVKKGEYMIFNKKYSKDEYGKLRQKIMEHMKSTGEYGEFFPPELSPIGYNETQGQVYMPLTRKEVEKRGWKWEDETPGTFGKETIQPEDIPDKIDDVPESIINEVLKCSSCRKNYNIVEPELKLYKRGSIPLPRLCPDCRYRRRMNLRLPRNLWHRQCTCDYKIYKNSVKHDHHPEGRCPNEFETPYSPDRKEIIYCEACYNAEVV